jgi:hypothetical protein
MSTSTVYDVKVKYSLDDKASAGVKGIGHAADKAGESVFSLHNAMKALAIEKVFHIGKELLIDFNTEMTNLKIGMTTVMQMNMHMPFEKASAAADKLFDTFQAMAKKSPLLTKDFMEMASAIAPAISMAGGDVGKLEKFTQGALNAGLAFNVRPEQMSMDIQEMLAGNVRLTSRTARQLLASQGLDHNEFNQKSAGDRAKITEKILTDPALLKASERAAHTMAGEISTVKDNIQIAFGEIGKPLMHDITEDVRKMNVWIERHPKLIKEWSTSFSNTLKQGFQYIQTAAGWFLDHKEILMSLAKTFVMFKGAQIGTNVFKKFTDGVGDLAKGVQDGASTIKGLFNGAGGAGIGGAFTGLLGILRGAGGVIPALGLFVGALGVVTDLLNTHAADDKKAREAQVSLHEATEDIPEMMARRKELQDRLGSKGKFMQMPVSDEMRERFTSELGDINSKLWDPAHMGSIIKKISDESKSHGGFGFENMSIADMQHADRMLPNMFDFKDQKKSQEVTEEVLQTLKLFNSMTMEDRREIMKNAFPGQFGMPTPAESKPPGSDWAPVNTKDINVTIQKVEVASEDPDRFVFGLAKIADQSVKHSTQSQHTIAGGF